MAAPEAKQDITQARVDRLTMPAGGWTASARNDALGRVRAMGLPDRRDEYWKFTRPDTLTQMQTPQSDVETFDETPVFSDMDCLRIVFVDGVFDSEASDDLALDHVRIELLAQNAAADIHWARDLYGVLEARGQEPVQRPLAALNTAGASDGVMIHVTATPPKPIHIEYARKGGASDVTLHHVVRVDSGAEVTLLETGPVGARFNTCAEIDVADDATFHHVRVQGRDHARYGVTHMFTRLGAGSTFKSFTLSVNGELTRNEHVVEITGDAATAHVAGACVGDGDFHHDDTVFITHDAVDCESRQVFKKVLRNGATGVFQGKILVKPDAQKTDGYQISQSLLLDDDSQFLAKPELEIYADDVACSHGSTSGAIDEEALFYLRSRGVPAAEATNLLTLAFLAEAVEEIDNADLAEQIVARLDRWLHLRS